MLPNRATAEQFQEAERKAEEQGGGRVHMRLPFEPSLEDREPMFYAQAASRRRRPRTWPIRPPQYYQPPGRDA